MKVFVRHDGAGIEVKDDLFVVHKRCEVSFCGVKIIGVVFVDTETSFVRVSIHGEKHRTFEKAAQPLFNNFKKLGKYADSGNYGYEFSAPNLQIILKND